MTHLKYNYIPASPDNGNTHMWTALGEAGAIHIWGVHRPDDPWSNANYYGGIELHSKKPLYDSAPEPIEEKCWLHGERCWHDGSGLYFSDAIEPMIRHEQLPFSEAVNEFMYSVLYNWYKSNLESND